MQILLYAFGWRTLDHFEASPLLNMQSKLQQTVLMCADSATMLLQLPRAMCVRFAKDGWRWSGAFQMQVQVAGNFDKFPNSCMSPIYSTDKRSQVAA